MVDHIACFVAATLIAAGGLLSLLLGIDLLRREGWRTRPWMLHEEREGVRMGWLYTAAGVACLGCAYASLPLS